MNAQIKVSKEHDRYLLYASSVIQAPLLYCMSLLQSQNLKASSGTSMQVQPASGSVLYINIYINVYTIYMYRVHNIF